MALLNFPTPPLVNGQLYPVTPVVGQNQYRWSSTDNTWVLEGAATAVIPGTYGSSTEVAQFTVDTQGRLTFAQNVLIASGAGGTVTQVDTGTGLTGGPITGTGTVTLDTTYTDTLYLQLAGGTMTGDITFSGTQTFPNTLKVVAPPTASTDPGNLGEVSASPGFFYFFDGTQWLQVAGSIF